MPDRARPRDALVADLLADLRPVPRLVSPWIKVAGWLAIVLALAVALASVADLAVMKHRMMAVPDMWQAMVGSGVTAALAAVAAFQLGLPDRSPAWGLCPLPGLALWLGASGMGCARDWLVPGASAPSTMPPSHCVMSIVSLSVPLSVAIFVMLRRGYSLHPSLMGVMAGLAVAAAAATLLDIVHPYDAAVTDLAVHAAAIALVVLANRFLGVFAFPDRRSRMGG